ncbi:peptide chain release factor 2 [Chitinivibrio alkaliphilus]|uniref:Peptide chain release factor 2 n=1 Tax=Chitinivibrio alkaliphilus ACht1 TaxID=1313304 RepID=U7D9M6_9BACT|nr:peptide chain release factor 2 [Chitinivibrio alkaliphilus]ERP38727.1 peptide chain release factor 2 [Chitinivibrio alkaliphilus ACht1]
MEEYISKDEIEKVLHRINDLKRLLEIDTKCDVVAQLTTESQDPAFWNDTERAQGVLQKMKGLKDVVEAWEKAAAEGDDISELYDMTVIEEPEALSELTPAYASLLRDIQNLEFFLKMSGEDDNSNAILTIHSGAGGTESCDWAGMLHRMYERWFEKKGFSVEMVEYQAGDGAGIKSVTLEVRGEYAYGHLKAENGVHRLVRISPFDSNARRHTSFASVYSYPVIEGDIDLDINKGDLRIDTYRASGAGGQHVNKTDSAVRITHTETGIVVQCQSQRSQIKNRETAMKMLKARLRHHYKELEKAELQDKMCEKKKIEWGSQIRSYVMHPYNMVKDHRTSYETSNVEAVLDGSIDDFIEKYLLECS